MPVTDVTVSSFGARTSWLALGNAEVLESLVHELQLVGLRPCEWGEGLNEASSEGIFITPRISGWRLIVGLTLPDASSDHMLSLMVRLSEKYGSAQYFGNHRVTDYYAWARADAGRLVRAYAYIGAQNGVVWDRGELTKEEVELGMHFEDIEIHVPEDSKSVLETLQHLKAHPKRRPEESDVFAIARKWSVDPTEIEEYEIEDSLGLIGYLG